MNEIKEIKQCLKRYVIATQTEPTMYLRYFDKAYSFIDNLVGCVKISERDLAEEVKENFYRDTGLTDIELVVLPMKIEYRIEN